MDQRETTQLLALVAEMTAIIEDKVCPYCSGEQRDK